MPFLIPINTATGQRLTTGPWDIKIHGFTFELKTATEDVNGNFQFNHIRYHRQYDGLICLGVSPANLYFNVWTAADVKTGKAGTLTSMEKGANASYKLSKGVKSLKPINDFQITLNNFLI